MEKYIENLNEWRQKIKKRVHDTSALRIIPVIFLIIIFVGTLLLMLPAASKSGEGTGLSVLDAAVLLPAQ